MRLTLRTLLSWTDGMLEPAAAAELGARVAASPAAGQLRDRSRDVVARQMLSAPAPAATGFAADADSTAEYLDNVMPSERIEEFERICFGSDVHLAEVAGCHEILAELAREPTVEPAVDRQQAARLRAVVRSAANGEAVGGPPPAARIVRPRKPVRRREGRRQRPRTSPAAWLLAITATLLLATLLGVLGWSVVRGGRRGAASAERPREPAATASASQAPGPAAVDTTSADREPDRASSLSLAERPAAGRVRVPGDGGALKHPHPSPLPEGEGAGQEHPHPSPLPGGEGVGQEQPRPSPLPRGEGEVATPATTSLASEPPASAIPAAAPSAVSTTAASPVSPPAPPALGQAVPFGDALAIAARPAAPPAAVVDPVPADAVAPPAGGPRITIAGAIVSGSAPLLVRVGDAPGGWQAAGDAAAIPEEAELLAPAVGQPAIAVAGLRITFRPGSRAALAREPDGTPRLDLVFGTAVVAAPHHERLAVAAGGLAGVLEAFGGPVAITVELDRPAGAEPAAAVTRASIVSAATVTFVPDAAVDGGLAAAIGPRRELAGAALDPPAAAAALDWSSNAPGAAAVRPLAISPAWLAAPPATADVERTAAAALAARLRPGADVAAVLRGLAGDRRAENRAAAVATLALLGDYQPLVEQLCTEDPRRVLYERQWRDLAAATVPLAWARGANSAAKLREALAAHAPPGIADDLVALARGCGDDELATGGDAALVAALESPHLAVRRWAFANLVAIVRPRPADEARYRADASAEARSAGVNWWRGLLERGEIRRSRDAPAADVGG
jgi:hypothetical protein